MDDILFEEEPFNDVTVKAATIDKLIQHCLEKFEGKYGNRESDAFVNVFFLTYHWYMKTEELLSRFMKLYEEAEESKNVAYCTQIYKALKYWLDSYGCDFEKNEDAKSMVNIMNTKIQKDIGGNGHSVALNLDDWNAAKRSSKIRLESDKRRESLNFNDMSGEDIGEQLLYLNWKSLKKIPVAEWMHYGKTAKTDDTPFLKEQIGIFNDISKYVMAMILNKLSPENRAKSMEKFVKMSKRLLELNDFNTLLAILGGMVHSTISRLQKSKEFLSNEAKLFINETNELLSSDKNYNKYRTKADATYGFVIPILGVVMKDLVALETAVKDYVDNNGVKLVNFHKMVQVAGILEQTLRSRHIVPLVHPKKEVFNVIRLSLRSRYSEDDLYEMSLQREPRSSPGSTKTPLPKERPVFADWASGISQVAPDRETVERHVTDMVEAVFKTYDLDKNGSINKNEFDALASNFAFVDSFAVLDVNGDGSISRQEMVNYFMNASSQEMTKEFLHDFQEQSFYSPHYCVYCMGFLWGIGKSGYRCKVCQISCHKDCKNHVVMECRPNRTLSLREKPSKSQRKRLKYVDMDWQGSTDSQISASDTDTAASPSISRNSLIMTDVFSHSFDVADTTPSYVGRLKDKIARLEMEKEALKKENGSLKNKLTSAESQVTVLQSQLGLVRQQSVRFMLEQMERLNTCKETDV